MIIAVNRAKTQMFCPCFRRNFFLKSLTLTPGRSLRVHPVRLLLDVVPQLLVEQQQIPGTRGPHAGLQVGECQARKFRPKFFSDGSGLPVFYNIFDTPKRREICQTAPR
jgi:hypothetical protein